MKFRKTKDEPEEKKSRNDMTLMGLEVSDDQYEELKKELQEKRNSLTNIPKIRLKFFGEKALLNVHPNKRQPLMLNDLQVSVEDFVSVYSETNNFSLYFSTS